MTRSLETVKNYTDVHTYQRYFTYQVPPKGMEKYDQTLQMKFDPKNAPWRKHQNSGFTSQYNAASNDLVLRLRAEFRSAYMDAMDQGMRVEVVEADSNRVIVQGSTETNDERVVHLDSTELSSDKAYLLRYHFYEKSVLLRNEQDVLISGGHMG